MSQYLGDISAYALAVSQGYTGTEEEYAELMASYATVGQTAVNAAQTATTKASEAATSATTATNKASEATTAATTATNKAAEAQADADAAALDASQALSAASTATTKATEATTAAATATSAATTATTAKDDAVSAKTAAQTAQTGAETAAASVSASAAQIATNAEDISQLKSELKEDYEPVKTLFANKFNPRNAIVENIYSISSTHKYGSSASSRVAVFACKPNTKYTVMEQKTSGRFEVTGGEEYPKYNASWTEEYGSGYTSPKVFTTSANVKYIAIRFYDSGVDHTYTMEEHLSSIMVAEGEVTSFHEYGEIQVESNMLSENTYNAIDSRTTALIDSALENMGTDVYGIRINTDGTVDRLASAVGKSNDYVVGNSFVGEGTNDFDGIYPWSEIKTCSIGVNTDGDTVITYEGQTGFARDGSNGSVYVEIPKFFTKRYLDDDGNEIIMISGTRHGGFVVEPAFFDSETGDEIEHIYVGAYLTQTGVTVMNSLSGVFPESNVSLDTLRTRDGEIYDFVTLQALQKLISVEFGAVRLSSIFGGFSFLPWSSSVRADGSATNTNTGNFKGDIRLTNIGVGNTVSIATSVGQIQNRTITAVGDVTQVGGGYYRSISFDGDPVDLVDNSTMLYCSGQKTGFTDSLTYHTGRTNLNSGSTYSNQFRYRGIEGLWGTLGEIMDGIIVKDLKAYWSNIKSDYGDVTKCKRLNFAVPLQNTYTNSQDALPPQIKKMGWDFRYPTIAFPEILTAKSEQYYGDLFFSIKNVGPDGQQFSDGDEFIGISSMAWDGHEDNGLYTLRFWEKSNGYSWLYGSRAIIRHLT